MFHLEAVGSNHLRIAQTTVDPAHVLAVHSKEVVWFREEHNVSCMGFLQMIIGVQDSLKRVQRGKLHDSDRWSVVEVAMVTLSMLLSSLLTFRLGVVR